MKFLSDVGIEIETRDFPMVQEGHVSQLYQQLDNIIMFLEIHSKQKVSCSYYVSR